MEDLNNLSGRMVVYSRVLHSRLLILKLSAVVLINAMVAELDEQRAASTPDTVAIRLHRMAAALVLPIHKHSPIEKRFRNPLSRMEFGLERNGLLQGDPPLAPGCLLRSFLFFAQ